MLAGQIKKLGQIKLIDHPEPELVKPGQVIFKPEMACLCGDRIVIFESNRPSEEMVVAQPLGTVLYGLR